MFHPQGPSFLELAKQALSSTEKGYDLLAPKFDYTPFRTPDFILEEAATRLAPLAPFHSGLDLCCGTGAGLQVIRRLCDRVIGVDISTGMLEICKQHMQEAPGSSAWELVRANALALPFDAEFDVVVCFGALGHILRRDQPRFVREVVRVLRPGGRFVFLTSLRPSLWSARYWLARFFNAAMHVRNCLLPPPFVMFYLTFLLPDALQLLERQGFQADIRELEISKRYRELRLVIATRQSDLSTVPSRDI
ncbi:MAG TPA: class I SAM-dependent methyltransferase [Gemmataceae bacterium]|nr:class I SAM-dependent methyltransferase [Gemmataceae bacterium]